MKQERLNTSQLSIVIAVVTFGTAIVSTPRTVAVGAENSGWISVVLAWLIGAVAMVLFVRLAERFPDMTLTEYSALVFGRWLGKLVGVSFSVYLIAVTALNIRIFAQTITIPLLPDTPMSLVLVVLVMVLAYECHAGLQSIAQLSQVCIVPITLATFAIIAGITPAMDLGRLKPWFEPGISQVLRTAVAVSTISGESVVLLILYPYLTRKTRVLRAGWIGLALSLAILLPVVVAGIAVFGYERIQDLLFPTLSLTRLVHLGQFVEHAEVLFVAIWLLCAFLKVSILFYAGSVALAQTLDIDDYRPLVNVLAVIVSFASILPDNVAVELEIRSAYVSHGWIYQYGLAALVFLTAVLLRKGESNSVRNGESDSRGEEGQHGQA